MNIEQFRQRFLLQLPPRSQSDSAGGREAAVLLPVIARQVPALLLTRRADHLRHHPGQVAFPGGKRDPGDRHLYDTVLRETSEELGLSRENIEIIGQLPAVSSQTGFRVTPFVAILPADLPITLDAGEVAGVFEIPLLPWLHSRHFSSLNVIRRGQPAEIWFSGYQPHVIWGMTAGILRDFGRQILGK
ncbi:MULTISPECIES: CoA pyrophosphatase [unclassified Tatumella]|uniref:CoA pyrophosphatase n=1 Tax=unclassified Tatumella TaxID=2649542 RepID=UPI001BB04221|nr:MULTISPECIES: CoA pyrophosphatase [unclassified Tatumella]MBS0855375.1 CoA pyrophosphatase [Tatumella sp. JGM16]MBS0877255.1 CoA pyrophosphatase [Tatumella sp. JGM82]MBS0889376.1 CoA pyrophosphatase [Tatumella sp. JGM94]MBS0901652.1 CoA pyrophosphatase [Tatumella sp. JGM100]MBS0911609.1 CoA pyrophosphatase [Tatumella sp. JGM91]